MIQIDMFEVQLGAAMLLQFRTSYGQILRVLSDAGLESYKVQNKLRTAFTEFGGKCNRLDIIIGTHYDADHLDGLVPIIEDREIEIGEVWLPPVANDSERRPFDESIADDHLLAYQFHRDEGRHVLTRYLRTKARICQTLSARNKSAASEIGTESIPEKIEIGDSLDSFRGTFLKYRDNALRVLKVEGNHANDNRFQPSELRDLLKPVSWDWRRFYPWLEHRFLPGLQDDQAISEIVNSVSVDSVANYNLAWIRKSAADDAINAISLAKVVDAIRKRQDVPISCPIVPNGIPRRFVWRRDSQRFVGSSDLHAQGPEIMLLGPSQGLVEKHRNRLPLRSYAGFAYLSMIPVKSITPSNQLSYVARFTAEKQHILITGDAGFVDFKPDKSERYHSKLLEPLRSLHVVQVAHHAGNNSHFYRVLQKAGYGNLRGFSYLMVSHATDDRYRPTREFGLFLETLSNRTRKQILFTSRPTKDKVRDYISMIHPPVGEPASDGDVRLLFDGKRWRVKKHAIDLNNGVSLQKYPRRLRGASELKSRRRQ
jgi:hypothetical protein